MPRQRRAARGGRPAVQRGPGIRCLRILPSHAAAFARTSYETAWMKLHHPVEFGCGLLNNQPMGFYHPSVLVEDLKRHGLKALPVDINLSDIRCLPEAIPTPPPDQAYLAQG